MGAEDQAEDEKGGVGLSAPPHSPSFTVQHAVVKGEAAYNVSFLEVQAGLPIYPGGAAFKTY